ncbi:MAG: hypothetical protein GY788_30370 [bacterium]|nr:hypothetical protein [bacterium]
MASEWISELPFPELRREQGLIIETGVSQLADSQSLSADSVPDAAWDPTELEAALADGNPLEELNKLLPTDDLLMKGSPCADQLDAIVGDGVVVKGRGGDDIIIGDDGNQILKGGKGNDIVGGGGEKDKLYGGRDNDLFVFKFGGSPIKKAEVSVEAVHRIKDFSRKEDDVLLAIEADLLPGPMGDDAFVIGTEATTEDHRIIYDDTTGSLYFDGDGSGELMDPLKFGKVDPGTKLKAKDFLISGDET